MARIFKQTYSKPLPQGAQTITRKGKWYARFKDRRGRTREAPLSNDGKQVIPQSAKWYIEYRDADGIARKVPGYTDKRATEQYAAELEQQAARQQSGLIDRFVEHRKRPLSEHLDDWQAALLAKGNTEKHIKLVAKRARTVVDVCKFRFWSEVSASGVEKFIAEQADRRVSVQTANFYLQAIKQFCRWMVRDGRAPHTPIAHLSGKNVRTDRRHDRRALEPEELRRLLEKVRTGPVRSGMPGPERAVLYQLSAETGFRVGELRGLRWASVDLDDDHPTATIKAAYSKHRRDDIQPLGASTAAMLTQWIESTSADAPADPVFPNLKKWTKTAKMLKADLKAARQAWLEEAVTDRERADREESVFLRYADHDGRVADFHALRHTFITNLVRGGVQPKVAQQLARHSTITLTMDRYSHVVTGETADALARLPDLLPSKPDRTAARAS